MTQAAVQLAAQIDAATSGLEPVIDGKAVDASSQADESREVNGVDRCCLSVEHEAPDAAMTPLTGPTVGPALPSEANDFGLLLEVHSDSQVAATTFAVSAPEQHHDGHDRSCELEAVFHLDVAHPGPVDAPAQPAVTDVLGRDAPEVVSPTRTVVTSAVLLASAPGEASSVVTASPVTGEVPPACSPAPLAGVSPARPATPRSGRRTPARQGASSVLVYSRRRARTRAQAAAESSPPRTEERRSFISNITKKTVAVAVAPPIHKRRRKTVPAGFTPRRSKRIAGVGVETPPQPLNPQKKTVMRSLGLVNDKVQINQQALDDYAKVFSQPLTQVHIQALAALFGWAPADVLAVTTEGLSSEL